MLELSLKDLKEIVNMVLLAISILFFVISWLLRKSKNSKISELGENLKRIAEASLEIRNVAQGAIAQAEKFLEYSGEDKKQWAKVQIKEHCIKHGIPYTDEALDIIIEELISFSKKVNATEKKRIQSGEKEDSQNAIFQTSD